MPPKMENPFVKIKDTIINMENVTNIKYEGGNLLVDFQSGGDHVHRLTLSGIEAARLWAYLGSVVHELNLSEK